MVRYHVMGLIRFTCCYPSLQEELQTPIDGGTAKRAARAQFGSTHAAQHVPAWNACVVGDV